jgi:hypothetical protein
MDKNRRLGANVFSIGYACVIAAFLLAAAIVCTGKPPLAPVTFQLTVVADLGGTIVAPLTSSVTLSDGKQVAIKAAPAAGYRFLKWTVATECATIAYKNAASTTVSLTQGNDTVRAVFIRVSFGLVPVLEEKLGALEFGLNYDYYSGAGTSFPDFSSLTPDNSGPCSAFYVSDVVHAPNNFGLVFSGYIKIPLDTLYTFYAKASDGSVLLLNDSVIIYTNGIQSAPAEDSAAIRLTKGEYPITVRYFNKASPSVCTISYACPAIGIKKVEIGNGILSRPYTGPVAKIIITNPIGGETYRLVDSLHIRWVYRHVAAQMVYCEISPNNGKKYIPLSKNAIGQNDSNGHFDCKFPLEISSSTNQALIRVRDYPPGENSGVSNLFSIEAP